jgi:acetyl-CoA acetyltransferase
MLPGALKGLAVFRQTLTLDEVMASAPVFDPLTRFQCCPPTCGAAAAIVCSTEFAKAHGLDERVVIAAQAMTTDRPNTYGERVVTNPSGGLLSKGHPLGATGLAQCYELTKQLRGQAGQRQVESARLALQHNLGLGGACVVTLYQAVDGGTGRQAASAASATALRDAA